ncbi:MAG: LacI family transcriptional regulator [Methylobacteriaceae bacterium]|jgi:DNA-binding LacI/PurR family transcriptional regulator|nr:LacI family transcriptional regulator [Methylobacteriaceae bacterium]
MTNAVRIRDIAVAAGVSAGAVSRALKGHAGLSDETRARILQVAREQGYDFSRLRSDKIRRMLFLLHKQHNIANAQLFYSPLLLAVENACRSRGIALSFLALGPTDPVVEQVHRHSPDALLLAGFFEPELTAALRNMQIPVALVDSWLPDLPSVNPDNLTGGYLATRHLIACGRTRIAFLASSLAHYSIRLREKGYRRALYEAKLLIPPEYEAIAPPILDTEASLIEAMRDLLDLHEPPDAVFAYNDAAALIAMRTCQQRGLKIPGDIAFVGFDDIQAAGMVFPPLTTIENDRERLGREAVELFVNPAGERDQRIVPVRLIERKSAGE